MNGHSGLLPRSAQLGRGLEDVLSGFEASVRELKAATLLRLEDSALPLFQQDMAALEKSVKALEDKLKEIKDAVSRETQALHKVEGIVDACSEQAHHLTFIGKHLPRHLPQQPLPAQTTDLEQPLPQTAGSEEPSDAQGPQPKAPDAAGPDRKKKKPQQAPRRYVSETEYGALSTYMTQRLPISKVNIAVDEAADLAEHSMKTLAQARAGGKMATQEWKRAQALLVNVAAKDAVRGKSWFTEQDLRKSSLLRADKTGKAIMTILRHLGRVQEVRLPVDGKLESIYVLGGESH